jgi:hypothetical protein
MEVLLSRVASIDAERHSPWLVAEARNGGCGQARAANGPVAHGLVGLGSPTRQNVMEWDEWWLDYQGRVHRSGSQGVGGFKRLDFFSLLLGNIGPAIVIATEHCRSASCWWRRSAV